jgi:hypothetical protein
MSTEYAMKLFHEDSMISGFLHVKIQRIRNFMKTWRSESGKQEKGNSEEQKLLPALPPHFPEMAQPRRQWQLLIHRRPC